MSTPPRAVPSQYLRRRARRRRSPRTRTAVWVADATGGVSQIDPSYDRLASTRPPGAAVRALLLRGVDAWPTLAAFGSIWIADPNGSSPESIPVPGGERHQSTSETIPSAIAAGAESVWVTNGTDGTVTRIDPATLLTTTIPVGHGPAAVAVNAAGAWVADAGDDTVVRIDIGTERRHRYDTRRRRADGRSWPRRRALWVANGRDGTVMRLDPRSGKVTKTIRLGGTPDALATAAGQAVGRHRAGAAASAGRGRRRAPHQPVRLRRRSIRRSPFSPGSHTRPARTLSRIPTSRHPKDRASSPRSPRPFRRPTAGGRTYTFTIRPGFRFSPPSNEPVTAGTFKATIERVANPRLKSPFASEFSGVAGYDAYVSGKARGHRGHRCPRSHPDDQAVAAGRRLPRQPRDRRGVRGAARYARPSPADSTSSHPRGPTTSPRTRLASSWFSSGTPTTTASARTVWTRSRSRSASTARARSREVEAGTADYALDGLPRERGRDWSRRTAPAARLRRRDTSSTSSAPRSETRWLHMNTSRPLFSRTSAAAGGELRDRPGGSRRPRDDGSPR